MNYPQITVPKLWNYLSKFLSASLTPTPSPPRPALHTKTVGEKSLHHTFSDMRLRHINAKPRRQFILMDDVGERDDSTVEVQLEDGMIVTLTVESLLDLVLEEADETLTYF